MAIQKQEINAVNADSDFLQPLPAGPFVIGRVDRVNGAGAVEVPFMPTRHELLQLVKYWAREILEIQYCWFLYESSGSTADSANTRSRSLGGASTALRTYSATML